MFFVGPMMTVCGIAAHLGQRASARSVAVNPFQVAAKGHPASPDRGRAVEILVQRAKENLFAGGFGEKRKTGMELHVVGIAKDFVHGPALDFEHDFNTFAQPVAQHRMREIGVGLLARVDRIFLRHRAEAKSPRPGEI